MAGIIVKQFFLPQHATAADAFTVYLDGTEIANGTLIEWGNVTVGETYYYNLSVENTGDYNYTVYLLVEGLPANWTLTWGGNAAFLVPNQMASGNLTLTVGSAGDYNWDSWIATEQT